VEYAARLAPHELLAPCLRGALSGRHREIREQILARAQDESVNRSDLRPGDQKILPVRIKNGDGLARMQIGCRLSSPESYAGQEDETTPGHEISYFGISCRVASIYIPLRDHKRLFSLFNDYSLDFDVILEDQIEQLETGQVFKRCCFSKPGDGDVALRPLSNAKIGIHRERKTSARCIYPVGDLEIPLTLEVEIDVMLTVGSFNPAQARFRLEHEVLLVRQRDQQLPLQLEPFYNRDSTCFRRRSRCCRAESEVGKR